MYLFSEEKIKSIYISVFLHKCVWVVFVQMCLDGNDPRPLDHTVGAYTQYTRGTANDQIIPHVIDHNLRLGRGG